MSDEANGKSNRYSVLEVFGISLGCCFRVPDDGGPGEASAAAGQASGATVRQIEQTVACWRLTRLLC
jgi:hypothetical protein